MLQGASTIGDEIMPGAEPELAPGVRGVLFDLDDGVWIPLIIASNPGTGQVGRFLDSLPKDKRVIFPCVLSVRLEKMLQRRGFEWKWVELQNDPEGEEGCKAMVKEPGP